MDQDPSVEWQEWTDPSPSEDTRMSYDPTEGRSCRVIVSDSLDRSLVDDLALAVEDLTAVVCTCGPLASSVAVICTD